MSPVRSAMDVRACLFGFWSIIVEFFFTFFPLSFFLSQFFCRFFCFPPSVNDLFCIFCCCFSFILVFILFLFVCCRQTEMEILHRFFLSLSLSLASNWTKPNPFPQTYKRI